MGYCLSAPRVEQRRGGAHNHLVYPSNPWGESSGRSLTSPQRNYIASLVQMYENRDQRIDWDEIMWAFQYRWGFSISRGKVKRAWREWQEEWLSSSSESDSDSSWVEGRWWWGVRGIEMDLFWTFFMDFSLRWNELMWIAYCKLHNLNPINVN